MSETMNNLNNNNSNNNNNNNSQGLCALHTYDTFGLHHPDPKCLVVVGLTTASKAPLHLASHNWIA